VNAHIARAALEKQHADEVQYDLLVKANTPVEPIRSGVDGGMNPVFLAQVGGRLPPARSTGAQGTTQADNTGSFTSKLLGFFGWKSSSQIEVASANTGVEHVSTQVTGTIPKIKPSPPVTGGPNIAAVELGKEVSGKIDELRWDPAAERDAWSQEGALTFSQVKGGNEIDSFDSRWNGWRGIAEPSVTFKTRWALESQ
jgi:hypothetical protein